MVEFYEVWYGMVEYGMRRGMVLFSNHPLFATLRGAYSLDEVKQKIL